MLEIRDLSVAFGEGTDPAAWQVAVKDLSFSVHPGEILAVVGESGSGKSVTALSLLRLLPAKTTHYPGGELLFRRGDKSIDLLRCPEKEMRKIRGAGIAMIFQEPMTSLNPVMTCGDQVMEAIRQHRRMSRTAAKARTLELFRLVRLPHPELLLRRYPHQLSGGQKQRVMIAMAISCDPVLLVADEPTTALDVTVQKNVLELLRDIQRQTGMAMIFITHDLGVVKDIADKVVVMYRGQQMETTTVKDLFRQPAHPYTRALLACRPVMHRKGERLPVVSDFWTGAAGGGTSAPREVGGSNPELLEVPKGVVVTRTGVAGIGDAGIGDQGSDVPAIDVPAIDVPAIEASSLTVAPEPLLQVRDLRVWFPSRKNLFGKALDWVKAVDGVSFDVLKGETLGIVGESGSGKTTIGRALLRLVPTHSGQVLYLGTDLLALEKDKLAPLRKHIQIVFQDPYASLNPRMTVGDAILEAMTVHRVAETLAQRRDKVVELLESVNLEADHYRRYPHAFSGGQRQRIGIARALALQPGFIVFDESVSALDVSVQAQVLNLVNDLKATYGFTAIFISHDLGVVQYISDRILVLRAGKLEEIGPAEQVFHHPVSAYTRQLVEAIPGK